MTSLIIIAKEPLPGRAKTRLHPALTLDQAAEVAAACIDDTLVAMRSVPATRRILFFDGDVPPVGSGDYELIHQPSGGLDERLAAIFDEVDGPALLIGMDTPQVTAQHVAPAFTDWPDSVGAWFGPATDGGFWALGLREPRGDLLSGVPMSRSDTGVVQINRLAAAGLSIGMLPLLTDVDTYDTALQVAELAPEGRFAVTFSAAALTQAASATPALVGAR